tara:strand:- start:140 stop:391 length:252 start_codon:yes stop_codon:yes gene_type:complete
MTIPTEVQYRYMVFIDHYIRKFDNFPSVAVLAKSFSVTPNASHEIVMALARKGYLKRVPKSKRYQRTIKFKQYMTSWPKGEAA